MRLRRFLILAALACLACSGCGPEFAWAATTVTTQATANYNDAAGVAQPVTQSNLLTLTIKTGPKLKVTGTATPAVARNPLD